MKAQYQCSIFLPKQYEQKECFITPQKSRTFWVWGVTARFTAKSWFNVQNNIMMTLSEFIYRKSPDPHSHTFTKSLTVSKPQLNSLKKICKGHLVFRDVEACSLCSTYTLIVRMVKIHSLVVHRCSHSLFTVWRGRMTGRFAQNFRNDCQFTAGCPGGSTALKMSPLWNDLTLGVLS